ncbi:MAG: NUDIX hydrolase [Euryarchaeota archaeon]|nr:NUDIX hydrolase [Euryarchaeota archaeon]MDE1837250.1 NUDIX hydrolase [Euryarchaeota archaeon]MDE1881621.1 NUDIX hydrolase [Euryarchaeota archaeon]MDE2045146.1 NUDIX hydrolase [Thermoplasmata archaeon]
MPPWQRQSSRLVHHTDLFELYEDVLRRPEGGTLLYTRLESPSFSTIVPVTEHGEIVFVEQYRPPLGGYLLELPGGMIEKGEDPMTAAYRELEEETGYRALDLQRLGWYYPSPHLGRHRGHLFVARRLRRGKAHLDPYEDLRVVTLPIELAYDRLRGGDLHQSTTMLALYLAEPLLFPERGPPHRRPQGMGTKRGPRRARSGRGRPTGVWGGR